ncbi:MAG TPA: hypothetical protein VKB80_07740 [Kofleriaceae bacterium]|nr:hypothetical protein [Kofleriaceae bacterium]
MPQAFSSLLFHDVSGAVSSRPETARATDMAFRIGAATLASRPPPPMSRSRAPSRVNRTGGRSISEHIDRAHEEEHVTFIKIYLSALLAIAALGCTDDGDETDGGLVVPPPSCQPECVGDDICTEEGCQPAFDRDYQVRLATYGGGAGVASCPVTDDCGRRPPYVAVYFSEQAGPILESTKARVAEITVTRGSSLGVHVGNVHCDMELTAARLRAGSLTCSTSGISARVSMVPMPL